jgi:hypothetical protein
VGNNAFDKCVVARQIFVFRGIRQSHIENIVIFGHDSQPIIDVRSSMNDVAMVFIIIIIFVFITTSITVIDITTTRQHQHQHQQLPPPSSWHKTIRIINHSGR